MGSFVIHAMVMNRKDDIESPPFDSMEAAQEDLDHITKARKESTEISLPWLRIHGPLVTGAFVEDQTVHIG